MKTILSLFLLLSFLTSYSQDTARIAEINLLVSNINTSTLPVERDTLVQDRPELGLKMTTYVAVLVSNNQLLKCSRYVTMSMPEKGVQKQMSSSNTFYYHQNKLIKVEEYLIEGDKKHEADWYYSEDKPLYYTFQSDKSEARATLLLTMSQTMLKQIIK